MHHRAWNHEKIRIACKLYKLYNTNYLCSNPVKHSNKTESPAEKKTFLVNEIVYFRDFDISVKCENYCTQLFLECLSGCDDDNCYGECHRNDYICVNSEII